MIRNHEIYYPLYTDRDHFIILVTGGRGCEDPEQEVMMADLSIRKIKDIKVGDCVMGDDFQPRLVTGVCQGRSEMYCIHQSNAEDYKVNGDHILTLLNLENGETEDIPISDFLDKSKDISHYIGIQRHQGNKKEYSRLSIHPAGVGDWCGIQLDGNRRYLHADGTVTHNSGKSYGVATFIERLTFELKKKLGEDAAKIVHNILYSRYTMVSAAMSVIPEFMEKIEADGTQKYFASTRTDVVNVMTGSKIMFRGLRTSSGNQTAKLKSIHGITTFVCDEAEEWTSEKEFETIAFSIRQPGIQNRIIVMMNPTDSNHFIYQKYIKDTHRIEYFDGVPVQISTHPQVLHIHTTYLDNIEYLSEEFINSAKDMKERNPEKYAHIFMGQWSDVAEGAVFKKWGVCNEFPAYCKKVAIGADWGFSQDPTTFVKCGIVGNDLYLDELCYRRGMGISDIVAELQQYNDLFIYADSADPRLIQEIANHNIIIYPVAKPAGSIIAGIEKMKDFDNIFVTERSYNLQQELRNYVWAKDKDGNYINMPEDHDNHCFTGDTLVTTREGEKPIREIIMGDSVMTSVGYKRVLKRFDNGIRKIFHIKLEFDEFIIDLKATPEHRIKTKDGWKQIQNIKKGDVLFLHNSFKEKRTTFTQERDIIPRAPGDSIELCGSSTTELFQKDFTFITKMKIVTTMKSRILNWLKQVNIYRFINKKNWKMSHILKAKEKEWTMPESLRINGMAQKKGENGTNIMVKRSQKISNQSNISVNGVVRNLCTNPLESLDIVPINVNQPQDYTQELTMKSASANTAEKNLRSISITKKDFAIENVQDSIYLSIPKELKGIEILREDSAEVFDLMVEDAHEYFANGLLVHNCIDAARYYVNGHILGQIVKPMNLDKDDYGIY